jgi:hypothetical protein
MRRSGGWPDLHAVFPVELIIDGVSRVRLECAAVLKPDDGLVPDLVSECLTKADIKGVVLSDGGPSAGFEIDDIDAVGALKGRRWDVCRPPDLQRKSGR